MKLEDYDLKELIGKAYAAGACFDELNELKSYSGMADLLENASDEDISYWICWYADRVVGGRWPEVESLLLERAAPFSLYGYTCTMGVRWHEAESLIAKDPQTASLYAAKVIRARWPEAEPVIATDPRPAYRYAYHVIKERWPEGEEAIKTDPAYACLYAKTMLGERWPEAEPAIRTQSAPWGRYLDAFPDTPCF